jgi:hypothetical protein
MAEDEAGGDKGFITQITRGTKYIEICLGDIGPGIAASLASHGPEDYVPAYCPTKATQDY